MPWLRIAFHQRPYGISPRKTRFRLVASLCRARFTCRVPSERFPLLSTDVYIASPFPRLNLAHRAWHFHWEEHRSTAKPLRSHLLKVPDHINHKKKPRLCPRTPFSMKASQDATFPIRSEASDKVALFATHLAYTKVDVTCWRWHELVSG